ncbi:MAG: hypothetical protein JWO43_30 [Candidatus Adlerbacteria bacterium]|nr:hypothetical protein [Candidatus Adlerbacteria bacterium]
MQKFFAASVPFFLLAIVPSVVFAAGFARQPMFLSRSDVVEGQTVSIYTVVVNTANGPFTGKLKVREDATSIGSATITLGAGEAQTAAVTWKPSAGTHTVSADLYDANNSLVESNQAQFTIASKIVAAAPGSNAASQDSNASTSAPVVEPSTTILATLTSMSPMVGGVAAPVLAAVDSARTAASNSLNSGTTWAKNQIADSAKKGSIGQVLGSETTKTPTTITSGAMGTAWTILSTLVLYILTVLQYVVTHVAYFYPIVALLFFYFLYRMYKAVRRPNYGK